MCKLPPCNEALNCVGIVSQINLFNETCKIDGNKAELKGYHIRNVTDHRTLAVSGSITTNGAHSHLIKSAIKVVRKPQYCSLPCLQRNDPVQQECSIGAETCAHDDDGIHCSTSTQ